MEICFTAAGHIPLRLRLALVVHQIAPILVLISRRQPVRSVEPRDIILGLMLQRRVASITRSTRIQRLPPAANASVYVLP